jgi:cob(I)alamin adenosyltransferase/cytidylate kinase
MNQPQPFITIAVDGGAASGKSSTSRALAERFGLMHVDTGAHYRTLTRALLDAGISPEDATAISHHLEKLSSGVSFVGRTARLAINGSTPEDAALRTPEVTAAASSFAALPAVRQFLKEYQRSQVFVARDGGFAGLIMEGRDIGSVILPGADLRLFLEADPQVRAARRAAEGGVDSIAKRDQLDSTRTTAPLVCPAGALRIDSTHLTLEEVTDKVAVLVEAIRKEKVADSTAHLGQMQELQVKMRQKIEAATQRRDLVIVHTGNGKGKSTAAFGMLARNVGHRRPSIVVQFVKAGDVAVQKALAGDFLKWHHVGDGFTWDTQDKVRDIASARAGWAIALNALQDPSIQFLLLDELNIILQCGYLPVSEVIVGLKTRASGKHVVITGRGAPKELTDFADLVTEMREIKHPFTEGVQAQIGVEF